MDQTFKLLTTVTFKPGGVFYLHLMIPWPKKTGVPEDKIHGSKDFILLYYSIIKDQFFKNRTYVLTFTFKIF
jgi:hypothetical protein